MGIAILKNIFTRKNQEAIKKNMQVHFLLLSENFLEVHKLANEFANILGGQINLYTVPLLTNNIEFRSNPMFVYTNSIVDDQFSFRSSGGDFLYTHHHQSIFDQAQAGTNLIIPCFSFEELDFLKNILTGKPNTLVETIFVSNGEVQDKEFNKFCKNFTDYNISSKKEKILKSLLLNIILLFYPQTISDLKINAIDSKLEVLQEQFISKTNKKEEGKKTIIIDMI